MPSSSRHRSCSRQRKQHSSSTSGDSGSPEPRRRSSHHSHEKRSSSHTTDKRFGSSGRHHDRSYAESSSSDSEVDASPFVGRYSGVSGCSPSESVRMLEAVCGTHTYTIAGYTLARSMGPGTRLCSDLFEVAGQLFRIEAYPCGVNGAASKYLSLYLTTPGTTNPSHLLYELAVVDKSTTKPQDISESRAAGREPAIVQARPGVVAGYPKFIKANFLLRSARRFLQEDALTIRATVKVLQGWSTFPVTPAAAPQMYAVQPPMAAGSPVAAAPHAMAAGSGSGTATQCYCHSAPATVAQPVVQSPVVNVQAVGSSAPYAASPIVYGYGASMGSLPASYGYGNAHGGGYAPSWMPQPAFKAAASW